MQGLGVRVRSLGFREFRVLSLGFNQEPKNLKWTASFGGLLGLTM